MKGVPLHALINHQMAYMKKETHHSMDTLSFKSPLIRGDCLHARQQSQRPCARICYQENLTPFWARELGLTGSSSGCVARIMSSSTSCGLATAPSNQSWP